MSTGTHAPLPHEIWAAASMAAFRSAIDLTNTMASTTASMFAAPAASTPAAKNAAAPQPARQSASAPKSRSWYKAPYRTPFDPMFWMSPGHPVDHMGDWIALLRNTSAVVPGFPAAFGPVPVAPPQMDSFLRPWMSLLETMSSTFAQQAAPGANDNVVDFASAYAAYRTAGGHAAAQIIKAATGQPSSERAVPETNPFAPWTFPMALFMPAWLK